MAKYELTKKAVSDLNGIWEYTLENWSEKQADWYYNMLLELCQEIADNPKLGKNYEGIGSEIYGIKASRHVIFYREKKDQPIEITRILHGQMDLKKRMTEK